MLSLRSFNPTLVRLRLLVSAFIIACMHGFNPTLVRLRLIPRSSGDIDQPFQSHAGSIEEELEEAVEAASEGFNPTLVRLRLLFATMAWWRSSVSIPRWFD